LELLGERLNELDNPLKLRLSVLVHNASTKVVANDGPLLEAEAEA
jgi:hypothetical protein